MMPEKNTVTAALLATDIEGSTALARSIGEDVYGKVLDQHHRLLQAEIDRYDGSVCTDTGDLSEVAASLLRRDVPDDIAIKDLGLFRLRDAPAPERLFQAMAGGADDSFPALRATRFHTANLPAAHTSFVGRKNEMAQLRSLALRPTTRLLSIVGAGGCGKTRLALELARELIDDFAGAVWFVSLADIRDPVEMMESIGASLGIPGEGEAETCAVVTNALSAQPSLLILDNFEGLVPEGVATLNHLLSAVPSLRCLLTSRQRAGISFELEFELLPLPVPAAGDTAAALLQSDSVQLFVERAKRVRPHFALTDSSVAAAAELCSRLDGIPLAIELAAAWAKVLTPRQMLAQLKEILVSRDRDVPDRHRSLDAVIEASCRMMAPELRRFFYRLSVFRGGWDSEAANAVSEEPRT
ncbi:MAG: AAA family ATPase, partial [Chloroflexi bacterium]|nr:AAA family ATPase [Chloroflexota bacterium]